MEATCREMAVSPPRLDLLLSESYELLHKAYLGITNNEKQIALALMNYHDANGNFPPPATLDKAGKPFLIQLAGVVPMIIGAMMQGGQG